MPPNYLSPIEDIRDIYVVDLEMFNIPEYGASYIIDSDRPAIVETGTGANYRRILTALEYLQIPPRDVNIIAVTHVHLDHVGGAGHLAKECENAIIHTHEAGVRHIVNPTKLVAGTKQIVGQQWEFYSNPLPISENRIQGHQPGESIDLGGDQTLNIHHAPGHTHHQIIYHENKSKWTFVGDAAGIYIPSQNRLEPTTPPVDFDYRQSLEDIENIRDLSPEGLLYTHFGPRADADEALSKYYDVLTHWVEIIQKKTQEYEEESELINDLISDSDVITQWGHSRSKSEIRLNAKGVLQYLTEK